MFLDKTDEAIAHFIGLLETHAEAGRLRKSYDEFHAQQRIQNDPAFAGGHQVSPLAPYDLRGFDPGIVYHPFSNDLVKVVPDTYTDYRPIPTKLPGKPPSIDYPVRQPDHLPDWRDGHGKLPTPGSTASVVHQQARMTDNDAVSVGDNGFVPGTPQDTTADLARMLQVAQSIAPLSGLDTAGATSDPAAMMLFLDAVAAEMRGYSSGPMTPDGYTETHRYFDHGAAAKTGVTVNGAAMDEAPTLDNYLRIKPEEEDAPAPAIETIRMGGDTPSIPIIATGETAFSAGDYRDHAFVDVKTGSNTLVNTAYIGNQWVAGHVMAAAGNYSQIDLISQVNVWSDIDQVEASLNGWRLDAGDLTEAFNVAVFTNTNMTQEHYANLPAPSQYPTQWAVTTLVGDLTILTWIEQLSFMSDNDIAVAASTGVKITLGTGENLALNDAFVKMLSSYYDLILVGGHIYDASIISQTNVLLDNDLVQALAGFQTQGQGQLSTGNNLLWNQASIENLHGAGVSQGLPSGYQQAIDNLNAGNEHLPNAVFQDAAFSGLAGLRVLHITGNFVNLNYIKQTNVLGDSDQIALAMSKTAADTTANWNVSSGQNQLINQAAIRDVDFTGKIYAAGNVYSDAMLVQAELVANGASAGFGKFSTPALATEAVAFLQDDSWDAYAPSHKGVALSHGFDHGNIDALHHMLS